VDLFVHSQRLPTPKRVATNVTEETVLAVVVLVANQVDMLLKCGVALLTLKLAEITVEVGFAYGRFFR
jgi:hypothetical protein